MKTPLAGFVVHAPAPEQWPEIWERFERADLGREKCQALGAYSVPGEILLGAAIVRPTRGGKAGHFRLIVRKDVRRQRIGTEMMRHLYQLALTNDAEKLILADIVHEDRADNAFWRAMAMSPETTLSTFTLNLQRDVLNLCDPIERRLSASHPQWREVRLTSLADADLTAVARFVAEHYSGIVDQTLGQLYSGFFDRSLSLVALRQNEIAAVALIRSKENEPSIFMDLILTASPLRNSPLPLRLVGAIARRAVAMEKTTGIYEADIDRDRFGAGFAARCGIKPSHRRFRYSIDAQCMREFLNSQ
jgi:GNAT superfamily N-acetyltransferase